jgi:hypothetical protein
VLSGELTAIANDVTAVKSELGAVTKGLTAVKSEATAVSNEPTAVSDEVSGVSKELTAVSHDPSAVSNELSAVSKRLNAVSKQLTAISNEQTAITKERTAVTSFVTAVAGFSGPRGERATCSGSGARAFSVESGEFPEKHPVVKSSPGRAKKEHARGRFSARATARLSVAFRPGAPCWPGPTTGQRETSPIGGERPRRQANRIGAERAPARLLGKEHV